MGFKLGSENRQRDYNTFKNRFDSDPEASVPGVPVIRKPLEPGIQAEANMDGSIFISDEIPPGSERERAVLLHEMKHIVDMKTGKLSYDDNELIWMGQKYERENGMINYNGEWLPEGSREFPWEQH